MRGITTSADSKATSEPVQFRGLLLIPVSSVPGVAIEVARGESVRVTLGPWTAEPYTLEGHDVSLHEDAGLRYVVAPDLLEIRAVKGEYAVVGPGVYVLSGVPGVGGVSEALASEVAIQNGRLVVVFRDGRELAVPLSMFSRLAGASEEDLLRFELSGGGRGIHWDRLNEDISVAGLLAGFVHDRAKAIGT